jgi:hypothetical protein
MSTTNTDVYTKKAQEWLQLELQLKQLLSKTRELRDKRNDLERDLIEAPSDALVKSKLKCVQVNQAETLTFKYLEKCLNKIIKNPDQAKQIYDYIKSNREVKTYSEIRTIEK